MNREGLARRTKLSFFLKVSLENVELPKNLFGALDQFVSLWILRT